MILVKLLLAHIIGDFFLQREQWIISKEAKKWLSPYLYLHVFIHFVLILLLLWDISAWFMALMIALSHYIIDGLKLTFQKKETKRFWFGADQTAHLFVILFIWFQYFGHSGEIGLSIQFWIMLTGLLFLTYPASYIMQQIMDPWNKQIDINQNESLRGAGEYIGMLERVFVYLAIIIGSMQIIGFLLAAKSIFRFGDLTEAKDRKLTEYILIGTLFSFLIAIIIGLISTRIPPI